MAANGPPTLFRIALAESPKLLFKRTGLQWMLIYFCNPAAVDRKPSIYISGPVQGAAACFPQNEKQKRRSWWNASTTLSHRSKRR
ncbi:protein of unknown function [Agrobacterium pusense]|uniref:Uncharacterized protein n=1 Tax=Agrobacterium pusense TaxID=648995 RepID=U4Q0A0_9HYPH|nr:protein of unknown function [Agrobacterium pusense]